jgi:hypothetical protein
MKEAPKASQSRTPGSFLKSKPFPPLFSESHLMTSDKNMITIQFHPSPSPLSPSATDRSSQSPKPKAQSLFSPSISYKIYFSPLAPQKTAIFSSANIRILYKMYNPLSRQRRNCHVKEKFVISNFIHSGSSKGRVVFPKPTIRLTRQPSSPPHRNAQTDTTNEFHHESIKTY